MKLVDKIEIDKNNENIDRIRKENSSKIENGQVPHKDRKGFCTSCIVF